jgi:hypothetical protein
MGVQQNGDCAASALSSIRQGGLERRIRGEYREMPGLQLSAEQATRLWALDQSTCSNVLGTLLESGFLRRDVQGRYSKASDGY